MTMRSSEYLGDNGRGDHLTFADLRAANLTRHKRYYAEGQEPWGLCDWMVAIGGEVGEADNLVKKLNRARAGMAGNKVGEADLIAALGDELADVVIYLDIVLSTLDEPLMPPPWPGSADAASFAVLRRPPPPWVTLSMAGCRLLSRAGRMAEAALDLATPDGLTETADFVRWSTGLLHAVADLAVKCHVDLGSAVVRKFNATSEALGFPERLAS